jgi:tRNA threonylcarbamoyladenosine biosynthesis protein TsaB
MILAIRTDSADSEVYLLDGAGKTLAQTKWTAGRKLSQELLPAIEKLLEHNSSSFSDLTGLVVFEGPGSFTGLRIGVTVANALAFGLKQPVVGSRGDNWIPAGVNRLQSGAGSNLVRPFYGSEPNITEPRK